MIQPPEFKKHLEQFHRQILSQYGYELSEENISVSPTFESSYNYYFNKKTDAKISLGLAVGLKGDWRLNFAMSQKRSGAELRDKWFSLHQYEEKHGVSLPSKKQPGQPLEEFIATYFDALTKACETYLRDQISGASFEDYDPAPGRV